MLAWVVANQTILKWVGIGLVFVLALGWVRQRAYDSGYDEGVVKTTEVLQEKFEAEKERLMEEIEGEREEIVEERESAEATRREIEETRRKIDRTVSNALTRSLTVARQGIEDITNVKDKAELAGVIRNLLAVHGELDREYGTISTTENGERGGASEPVAGASATSAVPAVSGRPSNPVN